MRKLICTLLVATLMTGGAAHAGEKPEFHGGAMPELPIPPMPPRPPMPAHGAVMALGGADVMDTSAAGPMQVVILARRLDLTPEQREDWGRIVDEAAPKMRAVLFQLQDTREALDQAVAAGKDDGALRGLADAQGRQLADLLFLQLSTRARLRALLTEEQRERLADGGFEHAGPTGWRHAFRSAPAPGN